MVRRAVEFLFTRVLTSRYGMAALLAVVVMVILAGTRIVVGGDEAAPAPAGAPDQPITTVEPGHGDDGVAASPKPPPSPVTKPGADEPLKVARDFTTAWLRNGDDVTAEDWHRGLRKHSTKELRERLEGADPAGVPAERITGELTLVPVGPEFAEVSVPVDSGRLILRMVAPDDRWLVDGVDWERGT